MGRPAFAPPLQAVEAVPDQVNLPVQMDLPTIPDHPGPGDHGMPELTGPTFPVLSLPDDAGAADAAAVDLPDIPAADLPDIFGI